MKKLVLLLIAVALLMGTWSLNADARTCNKTTVIEAQDNHDVAGASVDAPNLVRIADQWSLGVEGGKDILKDVFYSDTRDYFESDKGYFGYLKVTYTGCLLNCKKE